ncbi:MAG: hypothetical protein Kow00124_26200 [Anaerolineae bacterium]
MSRETRVPEDVEKAFEAMNEIPAPDPTRQMAARSAFLAEARRLRQMKAAARDAHPLWGWVAGLFAVKERWTMMTPIAKALAILLILSVTATGTAAAADASLPDSALYPVDLAVEQVQLALTTRAQTRAELQLRLLNERADEIIALMARGTPPDSAALVRLQTQLQTCLESASQLQTQQMVQLLARFRDMAQIKGDAMQGAGLADGAALMSQAREQAQLGIDDPAGFAYQHRHGAGWAEDEPVEEPVDDGTVDDSSGVDEADDAATPGDGDPDRDQTRDQLRDGSCQEDGTDCEPIQDQTRDQTRDQLQDGSCREDGTDCVPQGDQHQYGPPEETPGGPPAGGGPGK